VREEASQAAGEEAESRNGDDHAGAQALVLAHRDQIPEKGTNSPNHKKQLQI